LEYKEDHQGYIDLIINEMLPVIAKEKLADYIDVFCETGFFSAEETETICKAGLRQGLKVKIHANQLNFSGGVETGIKLNAVSVDHLETVNGDIITKLAKFANNRNAITKCGILSADAISTCKTNDRCRLCYCLGL
jgi:imidazolonepropionase